MRFLLDVYPKQLFPSLEKVNTNFVKINEINLYCFASNNFFILDII